MTTKELGKQKGVLGALLRCYFWNSHSTSPEGLLRPQSRGLMSLVVKPATMRIAASLMEVFPDEYHRHGIKFAIT